MISNGALAFLIVLIIIGSVVLFYCQRRAPEKNVVNHNVYMIGNTSSSTTPETPEVRDWRLAGFTRVLVGFEETIDKPVESLDLQGMWIHATTKTGDSIPQVVEGRRASIANNQDGLQIQLIDINDPDPDSVVIYNLTRSDVNDYFYNDATATIRLIALSPNKLNIYIKSNANTSDAMIVNTFTK